MKFTAKCAVSVIVFMLVSPMISEAQYDKDVFMFRGRQALADGKYSQAIGSFNILAAIDSTDYWTFFYRGIAKYNLGDLRGAQVDFNNSVRLNPIFTAGYHYKAITESRSGEYDKALEDLQRAIELRPGYDGLYFSRGVTYFLSQQFGKAVSDFDRYIRKEPDDPSAYLNRGASYLFLKDTTKALSDYNKAISLDRFEPEGYIRRGRLYAAEGDYDAGIADMDKAIALDTANTFAYFNRAIMHYERKNYNAAMSDLNRVLKDEPGNALTLYNRSLISAQVGNFEDALEDMDRVIDINPGNVLAYYNRASYFVQMQRWRDALDDYDKAIELYPDFAKAYMNRSYVENMLGMKSASRRDYETAQRKVSEYRTKTSEGEVSFADTTKKYSSLLSLDADFAKKDFDDEMLQHRDVDIRLRPLYRFVITAGRDSVQYALKNGYDNPLIDKFEKDSPLPIAVTNSDTLSVSTSVPASLSGSPSMGDFVRALSDAGDKQYNSALTLYGKAIDALATDKYDALYKAFYYMNRSVLRADMIDFISNIESNVQTLTMDDQGTARARVSDKVNRTYDYSEAIDDMKHALETVDDIPYLYFNLAGLQSLSSDYVEAIDNYTKAISLYPYMGDAYFNRGLVLIYLKDKEKGCLDLSRAGELGIPESYNVIKKYCESSSEQ